MQMDYFCKCKTAFIQFISTQLVFIINLTCNDVELCYALLLELYSKILKYISVIYYLYNLQFKVKIDKNTFYQILD